VPVPRGGSLELSFAQQRLWFLDQLVPGNAFYNVASAYRLTGVLDVDALESAVNTLLTRHEVLRTTFRAEDGRPRQVVGPEDTIELPVEETGGEEQARRVARAEAVAPFDLEHGPMMRTRLLRLSPGDHVLLITMHHIVSDGWSTGILLRELSTLYAAFRDGVDQPLAPLAVQYADFAAWQRGWLDGEVLRSQLDYWRDTLADAPASLELPTDRPRPAMLSYRGDRVSFSVPSGLHQALRDLSRSLFGCRGRRRGLAHREPDARRAGAADRLLRQHPADADGSVG
jgi:hypothetical protein